MTHKTSPRSRNTNASFIVKNLTLYNPDTRREHGGTDLTLEEYIRLRNRGERDE